MSVFDKIPVIDTIEKLSNFVSAAPPGTAAEYTDIGSVKKLAWKYACDGKVTLFKRRPELGDPFQLIVVRVSTETVRKLGGPPSVAWSESGVH